MSFKPVFIVGEMGRGGQERQLTYLLNEIKREGQSCALVIWEPSDKYLDDIVALQSIGVEILRHTEPGVLRKIVKTRKFIKDNSGTLLQSFSFYMNFYAWLIGLFSRIPAIGAIRNRLFITHESDGIIRFFLSSLFPRKKITNNRLFKEGLKFPLINLLFRNTIIVTNQLDMSGRAYCKPNLSSVIKTCSVGRLYPEKNLFKLIDSISNMIEDGYLINHRHAGKGPLLKSLEAYVIEKKIESHFHFIGELGNVEYFLRSSDVFLHSARVEGYPNVIMEAMANSKPIITTRCGDAEDLVESDFNGFCVSIGNVEAFSIKLKYLLDNQGLIEKFGRNSFNLAREKFNLPNLRIDTFNAYRNFGIK